MTLFQWTIVNVTIASLFDLHEKRSQFMLSAMEDDVKCGRHSA